MSRSKNRKIADLISGGTFDDGVVAASEVTGLHSVASTGNFNELSNKPAPFDPATLAGVAVSGSFNDLSDQPAPFDPSTLATVATTGAYSALSGKPSLGTASTQATGAFATAAQGTLAASAVQPNTNPTFGTVSASSLTGIGSIDATTAAALSAAGVGGISKVDTSGASQTLDVSSGNLFVSSEATADTTISFSNVPTEASWSYVFDSGLSGFASGAKLAEFNYNSPPNGIPAISTLITAIKFKPDGTKAYLLDRSTNYVRELNLSTPWLLSTATGITDTAYIGGYESYQMMLDFSADGTKMYTGGFGSKRCTQWNMSTAWDISTASYSGNNFSLATGTTSNDPNGFVFSADGTKLYLSCGGRDKIFQYNLTTAWNVGTASYSNKFFSVASYYQYGVNFKPDGTKMYINQRTHIATYNLSTPWDVSTASNGSTNLVRYSPNTLERDVEISPDGLYAYAIDGNYKIVTFQVGAAFDLTLPSSVSGTPLSQDSNTKLYCEFLTIDGGTNVDIINQKVLG